MRLRQTISEWVKTIKDALDFGPEFPAAMEARRVVFAQESARLQHLLEQTRKASEEKDELIAKLRAAGAVTGNMVVDGPTYYIRRANTLDGPFCTSCFQRNHEVMRITPAPKPKDADGTPTDWVQCAKCQAPFRSDRISQYLNPSKGTGSETQQIGFRGLPQPRTDAIGSPSPNATDRVREGSGVPNPESRIQEPLPSAKEGTWGKVPPRDEARSGARTELKPADEAEASNASPLGAVPPQEDEAPKPVKAARKPRTRTRKPKRERPEQAKATNRSKSTP